MRASFDNTAGTSARGPWQCENPEGFSCVVSEELPMEGWGLVCLSAQVYMRIQLLPVNLPTYGY